LAYELAYLTVPFSPDEAKLLGVKNLDEFAQLRGDPELSEVFNLNGINEIISGFLKVNPHKRMSLEKAMDILALTVDDTDVPNAKKIAKKTLKVTKRPS